MSEQKNAPDPGHKPTHAEHEPPTLGPGRLILNWVLAAAGLGGIFLLGNFL